MAAGDFRIFHVDTLPQDRAPMTPPVPGPNPWMALVETAATDEAVVVDRAIQLQVVLHV